MSVRRRALVPATVLAVSALALSGCSFGQLGVRAGSVTEASSATISVTPAPTGAPVTPSSPVVVKVEQGRLTDVVVMGPDGPLVGAMSVDGRTWTSEDSTLDYNATYSVKAYAVDRVGLPTDVTQTLTTVAPSKFLDFSVTPKADATVGIGLPIKMQLGTKLKTDAAKQALEKNLEVTVDGGPVVGGWFWLTDDVLEYRPETYWPGESDITRGREPQGREVHQVAVGREEPLDHVPHRPGDDLLRRHADAQAQGDQERQDDPRHPDHHRQGRLRHPLGRQGDHDEGADPPHGRLHRWHGPQRPRVLPARRWSTPCGSPGPASSSTPPRGPSAARVAPTSRTAAPA